MLKPCLTAFVALMLLFGIAPAQNAEPPQQVTASEENEPVQPMPDLADRQALELFFDDVMAQALDSDHIVGGVVAVVRDGQMHFTAGYGFSDLDAERAVDPTLTLFRVGSVAKLFVGTAVMQLVEQGQLDLDTDVNTYLSAFEIPDTFAEPITLRHLLTHTAGFEERIIGVEWSSNDDGVGPLAEALPTLMPARVRPPGEIASYSNWGVTLAGHIVELVSGLSFNDYVERNIFSPLGMTRSTFLEPLPPPLAEALSVGYHFEDDVFVAQDFEYISDHGPAGALSSTAEDMAQFMIAHLRGGRLGDGRILGEDSAAEMHRRQFGSHPALPGMAINFGVLTDEGRRILQHSGATMVFHANLMLLPEHDTGVFVAFNGPGSADTQVFDAFLDRYFPRPTAGELEPPADFDARADRYTGTYRDNRLAFMRLEKAMRFSELTVHSTGRGTLFVGDLLSDIDNPDDGVEFVEIEPNLFRAVDGEDRIAFSENASGEVASLFLGAPMPSFHRIAWYETIHVLLLVLAVSLVIFVVAGARGIWSFVRSRRKTGKQPPWVSVMRGALIGLCVTGALFAAAFPAMVLTGDNPFRYPAGTTIMLALPVAGAVLTVVAGVFLLLAWIRRYGTVWARLGNTIIVVTSIVYLRFLDMWNVLGWQL